ncbi:N-acetyl-gamma-glutamyl-phosphate reductase [Terriglobus roseus DSM 18391]|uniref:N-acetyl-gamma-glutamyl-phosphate reductase n=1 Tax=Terriglobus roseus (strain DSM 18391 / NRRL B-41598 / KBS 63) TaxID=926566 RepID=I3ZFJ6_TERRK|nr:N-acetyl-gamma-glutamyl-phosphate reductase [Terriglobus roseus]AFL88014.1 N-acetyl-gamma-glutamyl-phosphate reductase [Terriglobus roseus DSM 18391]
MSHFAAVSEPLATLAKQPKSHVRTAVAGVTGYAGAELARLLLHHPRLGDTQPIFLGRMGAEADGTTIYDLHPQIAKNDGKPAPPVVPFSWETLRENGTEILFLALPHEQSREYVPHALAAGLRVIDLSGAWRLHHPANAAVYKLTDSDPALAAAIQAEAVFGSPELHRDEIAGADLVANPGCYSTSIILALAPLVRAGVVDVEHGIICDSKSGVSGAGKAPSAKTHYMYAADNLSAYAVFGHRHTGELLEQLGLTNDQIQFTPHLLPIPRGILSTIYLRLRDGMDAATIEDTLRSFYARSPMVRVHRSGDLPQIQNVVRTSFCDIGFELAPDGKRLVLVSCLDNLLKGASGQAVQNMNVMCGWKESEGLL